MTSASKLFHSRRIRFDSRNDAIDDTVPDSPPPEGNHHRRTTTDRRHHHRQDLGACNPNPNPPPPPRRFHRHRISEHELVLQDHSVGQLPSGTRSIRRWGPIAIENQNDNDNDNNRRLPGVVLLARDRLVERLRGVNVSQNSTSTTSSIHPDDMAFSSFIEATNNMLEAIPISSMTRVLPPGLSQHAINRLLLKVFSVTNVEESSSDCSICLEGFEDGAEVINLACMHTFHSCCLLPWVELCGACPNCRKIIDVASN